MKQEDNRFLLTDDVIFDKVLKKEYSRNIDLGEIDGLNEYVEKKTKEKDKIIEDLRAEDKRLNQIIRDLHDDLRSYNRKVKMQDHIIDTQQDIINAFCELVGMINDKE